VRLFIIDLAKNLPCGAQSGFYPQLVGRCEITKS
jgi:hypothetical protein